MTHSHILIATLSTEPQGVTRVLDWLLAQGYPIGETAIVHTTGVVVRPAIERLDAEFAAGVYPGVRYRRIPITSAAGPVEDILSEKDAWALLRTLYRTIRIARQLRQPIHLSITSGRKTMAVYGMVAAQLLFGEHDRIWQMVSTRRWEGGEKRLHATPGEQVRVISVPVVRWADAATAAALLEVEDPWDALQRQQTMTQREAARRRKEFLERYLTPKERELTLLLVKEGLDNAGLARRLGKREQTVANQLTRIYRKFDEWRGFHSSGGSVGTRAALIAEFAPYLASRRAGD
ncbi:MAG: CRISPR-associated ring nuclease [Anaerolineales bacterium]